MDISICNFMPVKNYTGDFKTVHFVYETEHNTLRQPFIRPIYYCHLVTGGSGLLSIYDKEYELKPGCVFFGFAGVPYNIVGDDSFRYLYISFMGNGAATMLESLEINVEKPIYEGLSHLIYFWFSAISRVNQINANMLSESVLLYTMSYMTNQAGNIELKRNSENVCHMIVDYVSNHFTDPNISLAKLADIFNYTDKYLSYLFTNKMEIGFNAYLNQLRIGYARNLINQNISSISQLAEMCGYSSSSYFSKVFKKLEGISPTDYIRRK